MRRLLLLYCVLLSCASGAAETVEASKYDAFWLWGGVAPQPVLALARTVYVLQGQIETQPGNPSQVRFIAQGVAVPHRQRAEIWLAYRAHTLRWTPREFSIMLSQLRRWQSAGNHVIGVQIDFDARTLHLQEYLLFLEQL